MTKKKLLIKILIKTFEYTFLISFGLSILYFFLYSKPKRNVGDINPSEFKLNWEEIIIYNNNTKLNGWFIENKNSNSAIIILHGWPSDKSDMLPFTHFLSQKHNLLYIDIRGLGKSEGYVCGSKKEISDIEKWIDVLSKKGISRFGIFGYSYGGFIATRSIYSLEKLEFAIADSPFNSIRYIMSDVLKNYSILKYPLLFFLDIQYWIICGEKMSNFEIDKKISEIKKPLLIICGSKDEICYNENLKNYKNINNKVEIEIFDELKHGETIMNKKFKPIIDNFIERSMK